MLGSISRITYVSKSHGVISKVTNAIPIGACHLSHYGYDGNKLKNNSMKPMKNIYINNNNNNGNNNNGNNNK